MTFGDKLKEARKEKGYTQVELAEMIGVASATLAGYENSNREPDLFKIKRLVEVLEIDADYLLAVEKGKKIAPAAQEVAEAIDVLLHSIYGRPATVNEINNFAEFIKSLSKIIESPE